MTSLNALIFGATGGIGSAICRELNARGVNCYLIGRSAEKLGQIRKELSIPSRNVMCTPDITTTEGFENTQQWLKNQDLQFTFAIHCSGYGVLKRAANLTLSEWRKLIDANLNSAFSFFKLTWESRTIDQFELVYFGSASTDQVWPKNSLYGASKAGLEMFARSLQEEIRPEGGRVWLYRPGSVRTGFFNQLPNHLPREKMIDPVTLAKLVVDNLEADRSIYFTEVPVCSE